MIKRVGSLSKHLKEFPISFLKLPFTLVRKCILLICHSAFLLLIGLLFSYKCKSTKILIVCIISFSLSLYVTIKHIYIFTKKMYIPLMVYIPSREYSSHKSAKTTLLFLSDGVIKELILPYNGLHHGEKYILFFGKKLETGKQNYSILYGYELVKKIE